MTDKTNGGTCRVPSRRGAARGVGMCWGAVLSLLLFSAPLRADGRFAPDSIPTDSEGRVCFQVTYDSLPGRAEDIRREALMYLSTGLDAVQGRIVVNSDSMVVCSVTDSLRYMKQALAVYVMYMRYNLVYECADHRCRVSVRNISFMEQEDYDLMTGRRPGGERGGAQRPVRYAAREIMVDKAYKTLFVRDASDLITRAALRRINEVVAGAGSRE